MSLDVYLKDLLPLCKPRLTKEELEEKLEDHEFKKQILKAYALKKNLHNGATILLGGYTYRNHGLYFWDAQNQEIVEPFTENDDYGSVPPRFVVGDGYFNPTDWTDEVEHNTFVFPARTLINEMKEFAEKNPVKKKMTVKINGINYTARYNPTEMEGKWDSCIIEACAFKSKDFMVYPGEPSWRETIVDAPESPAAHEPLDSVVTSVLDAFKSRAATGQKKYGTNLDRTDLKPLDWIQHLQEELMDATLYLEKLKSNLAS
jgi:hypothetical protein